MATHWIITNREVVRGPGGREVVDEDNQVPLPVFRVAEFRTDGLPAKPSDDDLRGAVRFVEDGFVNSYLDVASAKPGELRGTARMFKSLYEQMSSDDDGDTLFFIHGFNYAWADSLQHLIRLVRLYVEPAVTPVSHIVYFSWPSYGSMSKYPKDQPIARESGIVLGRVFVKMVQFYRDFFGGRQRNRPEYCGRRVHIAAHSMGNQVLEEMFRWINQYDDLRAPLFGEALLLNADADWDSVGPGEPLHALPTYAERIHIYNHASDDALRFSETFKNADYRLGRRGPRRHDADWLSARTLVVDCSILNGENDAPAGGEVLDAATAAVDAGNMKDFLPIARRVLGGRAGARERMFDHWGYLHRPEVVADLYHVLRRESSSNIPGREPGKPEGVLYKLQDR